jgi:hypothetical protein
MTGVTILRSCPKIPSPQRQAQAYDLLMASVQDDKTWLATEYEPRPGTQTDARGGGRGQDLLSPATQIVSDREAYLGQSQNDIGRRISDERVELFIAADIASSLQAQFVRMQPAFITLHDLGGSASLRLLASLAEATGTKVQQLMIRRQGHGVSLAVLQFVEIARTDNTPVRLYSTEINADGPTRGQVAKVMLGFAQVGVLLVGDLPPHVLTNQLQPLRDAMQRAAWPNQSQLLVPVGSGASLATHATYLAQGSRVSVRVTPHSNRPAQAWNFIAGAWNRLQEAGQDQAHLPLSLVAGDSIHGTIHESASDTEHDTANHVSHDTPRPLPAAGDEETTLPGALPMPVHSLTRTTPHSGYQTATTGPRAALLEAEPHPASSLQPVLRAQPKPVTPARPSVPAADWRGYAARCGVLKGVVSACVFDVRLMVPLASVGHTATPERLAQQGAALLSVMNEAPRALGMSTGASGAEGVVTVAGYHLLVRPVPGHPGVAVHLVLTAGPGAATLALMQLERVPSPALL